jgi:hypothetical protein
MVAPTGVEPVNTGSSMLPPSANLEPGRTVGRAVAPAANVMSMVPDITAGTGTEFEETLVCDGSGGLSQSEGQEEYCGNPRPNRTRPLSDKS